jgi:uncharacterized protein YbjT (DUF2867 family)
VILVTGATGKVGKELVKELKAARAPFRVGVRSPESAAGTDAALFDFDRPETFAGALQGVDSVFLLTSGGTAREARVVDAAKKAGVERLVKLSGWGAEEDAFVIGRAHRSVEQTVEGSGLAWTFLRPNGFMQNYSTSNAGLIKAQGVFYDSTHDSRYSTIDARDIGVAAAKVLTETGHDGKAYKLSGPEALSTTEIAEKISRVIGRAVRHVNLPDGEYKKALVGFGMPEAHADALVDLNVYYRTGAGAPVTPDFERLAGRKPGNFDQFARDNARVWQ